VVTAAALAEAASTAVAFMAASLAVGPTVEDFTEDFTADFTDARLQGWLWTLLRRILSLRGQRLLRRWRLLRRPSPRDDTLRLASSSRPSLRINIFTGKTRRLNPAGLSCEECQRRSSLLTFILRESGRAERDCEVVQCDQGLWFYSTGRRNKGRVRPYLGR